MRSVRLTCSVVAICVIVGVAWRVAWTQVQTPGDRRDSHPYTVRVDGEAVRTYGLPVVGADRTITVRMTCDCYRQLHRQINLVAFDPYDVEWIWWEVIDGEFRVGHGTGYQDVTLGTITRDEDGAALLIFDVAPATVKFEGEYRTLVP